MIFLNPTTNPDFVPKLALCHMLLMQPLLKLNFKFPSPLATSQVLPKFRFTAAPQTQNSASALTVFSLLHTAAVPSLCCALHLGNLYKSRTGHTTFTSLNFVFPPVMIQSVTPLTISPMIYLLLSFVLKGIAFGPHLD